MGEPTRRNEHGSFVLLACFAVGILVSGELFVKGFIMFFAKKVLPCSPCFPCFLTALWDFRSVILVPCVGRAVGALCGASVSMRLTIIRFRNMRLRRIFLRLLAVLLPGKARS